ncbi:MAG: carboxypeptidase regulatory-like domain-containing protein [Gemmatimonadaceae bacterium]|nr:carboxypeptidase regulatory-like domain-containing protein [Gemmatimonadaceae bacterium]
MGFRWWSLCAFRQLPRLWSPALLLFVLWAPALVAQNTDVIRGRVTGPDSQPIANVQVRATSFSGNVTKTTRTDRRGNFTLLFVNGEGDYWLEFASLGYAAHRFQLKRIGEEEVLLADTRLQSLIAVLDQVDVRADGQRQLPNRNASTVDVGGGDRTLSNSTAVPPDRTGNIAAMAATVPGVQMIPGLDGLSDMFSVLGLSGDQNSTSYNGLGSSLNTLPPDAQVRLSFNQFPWDVARGGFSGAQVAVQTLPGTNFSFRNQSGFGTAPPMQWTDASADSTAQKSTTLRYGGSARGPIAMNRAFYNGAYSYQRRFTDALTMLNASDNGLTAAGVARDSVSRLLEILREKQVPVTTTQAPALNATDQVSVQSNVDLTPSASGTGHAFTLSSNGVYSHTRPTLGGPAAGSLLTRSSIYR